MDFLRDKNSQFIITSSPKIDDVISVLHAKCYEVLPIKGYFRGQFEDSCLAWGNFQPEEIKNDVLLILKLFNQECAIVKFAGETSAKKLFTDGSEKPLGILMYNTDSDNVSYLLNGVSFSFVETKQYWSISFWTFRPRAACCISLQGTEGRKPDSSCRSSCWCRAAVDSFPFKFEPIRSTNQKRGWPVKAERDFIQPNTNSAGQNYFRPKFGASRQSINSGLVRRQCAAG